MFYSSRRSSSGPFSTERVLWLSGLAGTGKSTVAKSVCEKLTELGFVLVTFFVSRHADGRHDPERLLHTLVYQCAHAIPAFFAHVRKTLDEHPETTALSIPQQVEKLLLDPLRQCGPQSGPPFLVLVIDALDGCDWRDGCEGGPLLWSMLQAVRDSPFPLRLLVTSRAERTILMTFEKHTHRPLRLHDIERTVVREDIKLYLRFKLGEVALTHGIPGPWPSPEDLEILVEKAGPLFVYASTIVRFIAMRSDFISPIECLESLLRPSPDSTDSPFGFLDALYTDIMENSIRGDLGPRAEVLLRSTVGALVLLQDPLSVPGLARLLSMYVPGTECMVERLTAVLIYDPDDPIRLYHPSFSDFLVDRCVDQRFRVIPVDQHAKLAQQCLKVMNDGLGEDICGIGDVSLANADVPDLASKIAHNIPEEIRYSCRHWHTDLSLATSPPAILVEELTTFANAHVLHWLEVMSVLDALPVGSMAVSKVFAWISVRCPRMLVLNTD